MRDPGIFPSRLISRPLSCRLVWLLGILMTWILVALIVDVFCGGVSLGVGPVLWVPFGVAVGGDVSMAFPCDLMVCWFVGVGRFVLVLAR